MLREIVHIRQPEPERRQRWFTDDNLDLTVWLNDGLKVSSFQLCYDKQYSEEKAITWTEGKGHIYNRVNGGESQVSGMKPSAMLTPTNTHTISPVSQEFWRRSQEIDKEIVSFVFDTLNSMGA